MLQEFLKPLLLLSVSLSVILDNHLIPAYDSKLNVLLYHGNRIDPITRHYPEDTRLNKRPQIPCMAVLLKAEIKLDLFPLLHPSLEAFIFRFLD